MSSLLLETYVVRAEKHSEFTQLLDKFIKYKEDHRKLFGGLKSWKLYKQDSVQPANLYMEVWEFDSPAQMEEMRGRIHTDEGMKSITAEFQQVLEQATCMGTWSAVVYSDPINAKDD